MIPCMSAKNTEKTAQQNNSGKPLWRRKGRRIAVVGIVCFFALMIVLFMLPMWMETPQGQIYALEHIKRQTGLQISARRWNLGWFSPTTFEGLEITAPAGSTITIDSLATDFSLLDYFRGHWDLGSTVATTPHISLAARDLGPLSQAVAKAQGLRGSILLKGGNITLLSSTPGKTLDCMITEAQIPIASSDSAVHATLRGQARTDGRLHDVNITTTLPPVENWLSREAWFKTHLNIFAGGMPASVVAEWVGLSPSWQNTLGSKIDITAVCGPMAGNPNQQEFSLAVVGTEGQARFAGQFVEQDRELYVTIRPPQGYGEFTGRLAGALPPLLSWLNPTLNSAQSGRAEIQIQNLAIPTQRLNAARISGILTTRDVKLAPDGVLGGVLTVAGVPYPTQAMPVAVVMPPIRFNVEKGYTSCTDFQIMLNRRMIRMSGSVSLQGQVDLYAQVAAPTSGPLSTATVTVPIRGTIDSPAVSAAE